MKNMILALLVSVAVASPVLAQESGQTTVTGTVIVANSDSLVVNTATGPMTFKLDSMLDHVRYDGLKAGSRVEVTHKLDENGRQAVTYVSVLQDPAMTTYDTKQAQAGNVVPGDSYAAADARRDKQNRLPATAGSFTALTLLSLIAVLGGVILWANSKGGIFGYTGRTSFGKGAVRP